MPPYQKFIFGLKLLNLKYEGDVEFWKYRGGDDGTQNDVDRPPKENYQYYQTLYPGKPFPKPTEECICGVKIVKNCYISKSLDSELYIIGSCCIENFMLPENRKRTCEVCDTPHRNRKDNRCHDCRNNGYARVSCYRCHSAFKQYNKHTKECDSCKTKKWCKCGNEIHTGSTLLNCDTCEQKKPVRHCKYCKCQYKSDKIGDVCHPCSLKNRCLCGVELLPGKFMCYLCFCKSKKYCIGCKSVIKNEKYDICYTCHQKAKKR